MAKQAKDQMKVKTGLKTYECKWSFSTPVEKWSKETLLANIRAGIRYRIARKITLSVQSDETNMTRNLAMIKFMESQTKGDVEALALMNAFCKEHDVKTTVQTEFIFHESDFMEEEDEPEEEEKK